jgi:hypothetical protein
MCMIRCVYGPYVLYILKIVSLSEKLRTGLVERHRILTLCSDASLMQVLQHSPEVLTADRVDKSTTLPNKGVHPFGFDTLGNRVPRENPAHRSRLGLI